MANKTQPENLLRITVMAREGSNQEEETFELAIEKNCSLAELMDLVTQARHEILAQAMSHGWLQS